MRPTPRIVHVTTTDISLALLLGPQLQAFAAAGFEVLGVSAPGPFVAGLEAGGIAHVPLRHATRAVAPGHDGAAFAELVSVFRRLRPDLVHTHNPKPGVLGRVAARAARVPAVVNTVHGLYAVPGDPPAKRAVVYGLERLAASCSHAELVQNAEDLETLARLGVARRKLVLLGNGVDLDRFRPDGVAGGRAAACRAELGAGPHDTVCLVVGRLVAEKGYREVFAAARLLRSAAPGVRVVVAGPAEPDKADAITPAEQRSAEAEGAVRFLGLRHDVEALYAASDVFVLASHREGFPRAAMEASAMGLPVVATDVRGCRQVVDHGVTGLLVPPGDHRRLAAAIGTLAADAALRRRLGTEARAKATREFDHRRVIDRTLAVYGDLLSRPRAVRAPA
ncbi:MAG TPA: glycosyltransferase family 4 protein [Acidimicrobiales bacterium]|nr:glycosyltransferase family 4 protein [Acidimicrobiales bacterium]